MSSRQSQIQEDTYFRILRILNTNPELSQRDLAKQLGMSLGGLNYCLKALIQKGFVKLENFQSSKHKFGYAYILTPTGMAQKMAMTARFLQRKMDEYESLKTEIASLSQELSEVAKENSLSSSNHPEALKSVTGMIPAAESQVK